MYANGIILSDKTSEIEKLKNDALSYYNLEFEEVTASVLLCNKYLRWNLLYELQSNE